MKLSSIRYAFRDAFHSMRRNALMTMASIATMAISLLILGSAWLLVLNSENMAGDGVGVRDQCLSETRGNLGKRPLICGGNLKV